MNYLRNFIPKASTLLEPFYDLLNKEKYPCLPPLAAITQKLEHNFVIVKQAVTNSIKLKLFDPQSDTIIYTDASLTGAASVLFQKELKNGKDYLYPISFHSLCFTDTQQRYSTVECELFVVNSFYY